MIAYYNAADDEILFKKGRLLFARNYLFKGVVIPNELCLVGGKINYKNWNRALKKGWVIRLGKL